MHLDLGWVSGFFPKRVISVPHSYATVASAAGFRPLLIATQESAGSALDWVARLMGYGDTPDLAAAYGELGTWRDDDPFLLPWFAGERVPVDNDALRGTIYGLSIDHDRQAVARAAIEGVALNLRWAYDSVYCKVVQPLVPFNCPSSHSTKDTVRCPSIEADLT